MTRKASILVLDADPAFTRLVEETLTSAGHQLTAVDQEADALAKVRDRKSTRLNSSHRCISYAVFCLKKKMFDALLALVKQRGHDLGQEMLVQEQWPDTSVDVVHPNYSLTHIRKAREAGTAPRSSATR